MAQPLQGGREGSTGSQAHYRRDAHQLTPSVAFLHLTVDQLCRHLPPEDFAPSASHLEPVSEMGGQSIKIDI